MIEVVQPAFRASMDLLLEDLASMPLDRWNESVFRFFFCRAVATQHPDVRQFVEAGRIDLVLERAVQRAFIEFKFYDRRIRVGPYDSKSRGYKGGPGRKNLGEFQRCIDALHQRPWVPELSKFVVLVYADGAGYPEGRRFSRYLDEYEHPDEAVALQLLDSCGPSHISGKTVQGKLFEVGSKNARA
ncbi:MAG: hypothetical protein WEB03_13690 [Nitriliruptor sp.]|uniref:hypothetical protein n=1 Tax=Nitriliruptor sp. TaxID=2448056 RepID=UPI00349FD88F